MSNFRLMCLLILMTFICSCASGNSVKSYGRYLQLKEMLTNKPMEISLPSDDICHFFKVTMYKESEGSLKDYVYCSPSRSNYNFKYIGKLKISGAYDDINTNKIEIRTVDIEACRTMTKALSLDNGISIHQECRQITSNNLTNRRPNSSGSEQSITDKLTELKKLMDEGIITDSDYETKKQEILKDY